MCNRTKCFHLPRYFFLVVGAPSELATAGGPGLLPRSHLPLRARGPLTSERQNLFEMTESRHPKPDSLLRRLGQHHLWAHSTCDPAACATDHGHSV